jgi:two-component system, LytTR family, sensor kinase
MARWQLHVFFWLAYWALETYFGYAWVRTTLADESIWQVLSKALLAEAALLPHKIALVYACFWGLAPGPRLRWWHRAILLGLALAAAAVVQRLVLAYWVGPVVYGLTEPPIPFDLNRFNNTLGDLLFVAGLGVALHQYWLQLRAQAHERNLTREKLEAELRFLRNQTNPHFLFNTLNNIYALARKKSDQAPEVILKLSQLLRFMLYECHRERITVAEEIKVIEDYLSLEAIRYQNRLHIDFQRQVDSGAELIAPLILLPLVENAFKHGASESRFAATIRLGLGLAEGQLRFEVENSKEHPALEVHEQIGLANLRRQLELLYPGAQLLIENGEQTFRVVLTIQLRQYATLGVFDH